MPTGSELLQLKLMSYTSRGKTYVRAYRNKWVAPTPDEAAAGKKGRSVPDIQVQVGVLELDGRVKMSSKFLARYPAFAHDDWYYRDHELVKKARQKTEADDGQCEADDSLSDRSIRLIRALARESGIERALIEAFGRKKAEKWLSIALFKTLSAQAPAADWPDCYEDWADSHASVSELVQTISGEAIRECLSSLSESDWDAFWRARRDGLEDRPEASPRFALFDLSTIVEANPQSRRRAPFREHVAVVCERASGRFVTAFSFAGPICDREAPAYCVKRAERAGIPAHELLLICEANEGLSVTGASFLASLPIADESKAAELILREGRDITRQIETWDAYHAVHAMSVEEEKNALSRSFTHLVFDPVVQMRVRTDWQRLAVDYVEARHQGRPLDERRFEPIRPFIREGAGADAPFSDIIDNALLNREADLAGWLSLQTDTVETPSEATTLYWQFIELNSRFGRFLAQCAGRPPQPEDIRRSEILLFLLCAECESRFNRKRSIPGDPLASDLSDASFSRILGILESRDPAAERRLQDVLFEDADAR